MLPLAGQRATAVAATHKASVPGTTSPAKSHEVWVQGSMHPQVCTGLILCRKLKFRSPLSDFRLRRRDKLQAKVWWHPPKRRKR